jgi:hypothetical protein
MQPAKNARRAKPAPEMDNGRGRPGDGDEAQSTATPEPEDPVVKALRENPGRWIAWNEKTRDLSAITDSYNDALDSLANPDDPDVRLEMAPGFHPQAAIHRPPRLLPWESPNVLDDVRLLWGEAADAWLDHPNPHFGGRPPRELVGTDEERLLREMLRAVRDGMTS